MAENDNLVVRIIRSSEYINEMYESACNDKLLFKYINSSNDDKAYFRIIIEALNELDKNELLDKEKIILEKYLILFNNLILKCKNKELSDDEANFLLSFLSSSLINNKPCSYEIIISYLNNYFFKGKIHYTGSLLVLLNSYMLNFINQMTNANIELKYVSSYLADSEVSICQIDEATQIWVLRKIYVRLLHLDNIAKEDFYYLYVYMAYALLHECCHNMQFNILIKNKDNDEMDILEKEYTVIENNRDFYLKYKSNFKIEQDADNFAFKYIKSLLKNTIPIDMLNQSLDKMSIQLQSINENKMNDDDFKILLDTEYEKIKHNLDDMARCKKSKVRLSTF